MGYRNESEAKERILGMGPGRGQGEGIMWFGLEDRRHIPVPYGLVVSEAAVVQI